MVFASFSSTVIPIASALTAVIAAFAAVGAAWFAWQTVEETKGMREEAKQTAKVATKLYERQISEIQFAASAAYAGHEEQVAEQRAVAELELIIRRLTQLQRVAQALSDLISAAREELVNPSERFDFGNGRLLGATPIPALYSQLKIEVRILDSLGGPDLSNVIPPPERDDDPAGLQRLWTGHGGLMALQKVEGMIRSDESLRLFGD